MLGAEMLRKLVSGGGEIYIDLGRVITRSCDTPPIECLMEKKMNENTMRVVSIS